MVDTENNTPMASAELAASQTGLEPPVNGLSQVDLNSHIPTDRALRQDPPRGRRRFGLVLAGVGLALLTACSPAAKAGEVVTPQEAVETTAAQQPDPPVVVITPSIDIPLPGGGIQGGGEAAGPLPESKPEPPPVKFEPLPISEVPNVLV